MNWSSLRRVMSWTLLALVITACTRQPQPARIEEITFQSGAFSLVGDLRLPEGTGPFPVVLFVHGDAPADRTMYGMYLPIMERMLRAGYAVFSWDNPGIGESTGTTDQRQIIRQQAQIVLEAIDVMKARSDIEAGRMGLWGISMAGYVMPRVLSLTEDIAFMICVSCPGMSGVDQGAYLTAAQGLCAGVPEENADRLERLLAELERARTYSTYVEYRQYRAVLAALTELGSQARDGGREVVPEQAWQANDPSNQRWWNPIEVIEQVRIPVLAIFGERDTQADPVQGAYSWRKALAQAGNPNFRVEVLPGADHMPGVSATGCTAETQQTAEKMLQDQGYSSLDEAFALFQEEPGQHQPLSAYPYAPGYLELIEGWLGGLAQ
jgi:uncharacterized protein